MCVIYFWRASCSPGREQVSRFIGWNLRYFCADWDLNLYDSTGFMYSNDQQAAVD